MTPTRKKRLLLITSILAGVSIAAGLLFFALGNNMNHFYEIKDIKSGIAPFNKPIRVGGMVGKNSIKREAKNLKVRFSVTDFSQSIIVKYEGILPDLFREGQGVMAKGKLVDKNTFIASEILAKHDENYMPSEVQQQLEKQKKLLEKEKNSNESINKNSSKLAELKQSTEIN